MIPARSFSRQEGRPLRARRLGDRDGARADGGRRRCARLGRQSRKRRAGAGARHHGRRPARRRLAGLCVLRAVARRAADPSQAALDRRTGARRGRRDHRRHRAVCPRAHAAGAGCAVHRHHRHQRQVDDHGADRAYPAVGRARHADGRQYRPRRDDARSADAATASMWSSARPTRSIWRPRSTRRPASCST